MSFQFVTEDPGSLSTAMSTQEEPRMTVGWPGHGQPLTASRTPNSFPHALFRDNSQALLLTVREYTMVEIMNRISDKPNWDVKVLDDSIVAKWKAELLAQADKDISEKMVDESIAELRHKADVFKTTNMVEALDGVFKSDNIIPEDLRLALIAAVAPLENVPEDQKDWHPRSDGKVLDLVHPSIYPLIYGQTKILPAEVTTTLEDWRQRFAIGDTLKAEQDVSGRYEWSTKFQWLPCDVDVSDNGSKIVSYINNLQPQKHDDLYPIIEQVIGKTIPLWNQTLSYLTSDGFRKPRIELAGDGYGEAAEPEPQLQRGEVYTDAYGEKVEAWKSARPILQPEPETFEPYETDEVSTVNIQSDFGYPDRRIQVIVKLANIYLTPESPNYKGGSWHVEGAANENICASAIYYYDSENISESLLSFRQQVEDRGMEMEYEQDDHRALETIYGFSNQDDARIQNLGSVVTRQNRLITFPNVMQHRVNPFHLEDPSKPGHRKILALFLVDPHQRIISTANIPPQQEEWWEEHLRLCDHVLTQLPQELGDSVSKYISKPVSLEVAKEQRLELMDERSVFVQEHNRDYESRGGYFLCEH